MVDEKLQKKIEQSIHLLQSIQKRYEGEIELAYSGGKDSDVILQLAKEAGIRYRAIHKCTTIDPPGTLAHVKEMNVEIRRPKESFFQLVARKGFPSRFSRFCCEKLKEYKILDKAIIGVRKDESRARSKRYNEPTMCRFYGAQKEENHVEQIYPILEWTNEDVKDFILDRGLKLAPIYYDAEGKIIEFQNHPLIAKAYLRAGQKFLDTHPNCKAQEKYESVYEWFTRDVFFSRNEEWDAVSKSMFDKPDFKKFLEDKFGTNLTL